MIDEIMSRVNFDAFEMGRNKVPERKKYREAEVDLMID